MLQVFRNKETNRQENKIQNIEYTFILRFISFFGIHKQETNFISKEQIKHENQIYLLL